MTPELRAMLSSLFYGDSNNCYEVVHQDGLRRPAIKSQRIDDGDLADGYEVWQVKLNRELLKEWIGDEDAKV